MCYSLVVTKLKGGEVEVRVNRIQQHKPRNNRRYPVSRGKEITEGRSGGFATLMHEGLSRSKEEQIAKAMYAMRANEGPTEISEEVKEFLAFVQECRKSRVGATE